MKTTLLSLFLAASAVSALAADPAATSVNELGLDLHRRLAAAVEGENLCLSPYSIQCALVMAYEGANGATRAEMAKVLHYPKGDGIRESLPALGQALAAATKKMSKESRAKAEDGEPFRLANRLFGQVGYEFQQPYLNLMTGTYGAALEPIDFGKPDAAALRINGWVEKETKDKIQKLLEPGAITGRTRLVLVNAVYLKAPWKHEFFEQVTEPMPFAVKGKDKHDVPAMTRIQSFGYAERDGYEAVSLPYAGRDLQFVVLLPKEPHGLAALEKKLTAEALASCAKLEEKLVALWLPKFKMQPPSISLASELKGLGMKTAFDDPAGSADFRRIAPRRGSDYLQISDVIHKTFFAVDEKGTEAAAATAVAVAPSAPALAFEEPPKPIVVKVDRPFLFTIQHVPSGACLFLGRVTDPR